MTPVERAGASDRKDDCVFCRIVEGLEPASIVCGNDLAIAFIALRQFNAGHTLVIPRRHFNDVRELDDATGAAVMAMVSRVTRAVAQAFPNQGLSLWHSIGEAGHQEVPHLHIHVHPRLPGDGMLEIYPHAPPMPDIETRDRYAALLRAHLD
jgi:histidine triad (HIT) family protein